jgi:hypothetical protein
MSCFAQGSYITLISLITWNSLKNIIDMLSHHHNRYAYHFNSFTTKNYKGIMKNEYIIRECESYESIEVVLTYKIGMVFTK